MNRVINNYDKKNQNGVKTLFPVTFYKSEH